MVEGSRQSLSQGCAAEQSVHPDWRRRIRLAVIQRNTAEAIGLRLMATLDRDIRLGEQSFKIGASVDAALSPDEAMTTAAEILHKADMAMYRAKVKVSPRLSCSSSRKLTPHPELRLAPSVGA
jgi:GGDEF domain-containing protein